MTPPSTDLLDYTTLHELCGLVRKGWTPECEKAFGRKQKRVVEDIERLANKYRNPAAHHRPLHCHERALTIGLVGVLTLPLIEYRSISSPSDEIYPVLAYARDCFGNEVNPGDDFPMPNRPVRLRAGDEVTFDVGAADPAGRTIVWSDGLMTALGRSSTTTEGEDVTMRWTVMDDHVGETAVYEIKFAAKDDPYHRKGSYDGRVMFHYEVLPPESFNPRKDATSTAW